MATASTAAVVNIITRFDIRLTSDFLSLAEQSHQRAPAFRQRHHAWLSSLGLCRLANVALRARTLGRGSPRCAIERTSTDTKRIARSWSESGGERTWPLAYQASTPNTRRRATHGAGLPVSISDRDGTVIAL